MALLGTWRKRRLWGNPVSPEKLAEKLALQEQFSRLLQDTADIVVFTHGPEGRLLSVNRHGRWLSGLDGDPRDCQFMELLHEPPADLALKLQELREGRRNHYRHETALLRPNTEPLLLAWWHVPWQVDGQTPRIISIGLDISDQRLAEEHLGWLSMHDPLTGLLNRRGFLERARTLATAQQPFALMLLDLDQFKDINDLRGHQEGDRLLQQVSKSLRSQLRQSDIIARLGGDEFGILLPNADADTVARASERCCEGLRQLPPLENSPVNVTTSIGVVLFPEHGDDVDQLRHRPLPDQVRGTKFMAPV